MNNTPGRNSGWRPDSAQIAWTANFIRMMRQGATWAVPANGCVYTVDHAQKTLWLEVGPETDELHQRTVVTFGQLGWTVKSRNSPPDNPDEVTVAESVWRLCSASA